jgi:Protein of unknown function (DUF2844)
MAANTIMLQNEDMSVRSVSGALLLLLGIGSLWAAEARASLGGDLTSVLDDAAELRGAVQASPQPQYEIEEIVTDNGMHVREFLNRNGIVFAVAWSGPVTPDLQRLLGVQQFAVYTTALAALPHPGLQRSVRVATPDLVVESEGRLRNHTGRAYLPTMIPVNVSTAELR